MSTMLYLLVSVIAFAITAALGKWMIPFLHKLKFGQTIREVGPSWHKNKQGTPTMGGLMFILGIAIAMIAGMVFMFLIYMFVMSYGGMVMSSVVEEKTDGDIFILSSSVKPPNMHFPLISSIIPHRRSKCFRFMIFP